MSTALFIDTSSAYCSVALQHLEQQFSRHVELGRRHNEFILEQLDEVFSEADIAPTEVDVVGFNAGPGSFTGVRIAASVAQAIAFAGHAKVVPLDYGRVLVNSLESTQPAHWVALWPSRAQLFYTACYGADEQARDLAGELSGISAQHPDRQFDGIESPPVVLVDQAPAWVSKLVAAGWGLVGTAPTWLPDDLRELCVIQEPRSIAQLPMLLAAHQSGASMDPELALPRYLVEDSPWQPSR